MQLKKIGISYLTSVILYALLDALWIGGIAKDFYTSNIGHLFSTTINWNVVGVFYLLFAAGLSIFVLIPALKTKSLKRAILFGALFGFSTFITYDLTNWATLTGWTAIVSYVDVAWGTFASAFVAAVSYSIAHKLS